MTENNNQKLRDEYIKLIEEICEHGHFTIDVTYALNNYEGKTVEELIKSEKYPSLSKEKKDTAILSQALFEFFCEKLDKSIFEYLIFEYKISEDAYINLDSKYKSKIIEDMFSKRKLNTELNIELKNSSKNNTKPKL